MPTAKQKCYCEKCKQTLDASQFYSSNNLEKYPLGKLRQCKQCVTMHVDNWDPQTFIPILEEIDVPYIENIWNDCLSKWATDPSKVTGTTILGRYLSVMKLKQHRDERFKDTELIAEKIKAEKTVLMKENGFTDEEIEKELAEPAARPAPPPPEVRNPPEDESTNDDTSPFELGVPTAEPVPPHFEEPDEFEDQLTDEDKLYLKMKWGKNYRAEEWVRMEKLYDEMMASYDIQGAGHKDTLIMICKVSLKANQMLDMGDYESFQKLSRTYDTLMKSGKFTAAQNKGESGEFVDSIGEFVEICEKEGFIPRYYTDGPQDKVDRTLQDLQNYTRSLVNEETNLGDMIEQSLKQIMQDREREATEDADDSSDDSFEEDLFSDELDNLSDEDIIALKHLGEDQDEEELIRAFSGYDDEEEAGDS